MDAREVHRKEMQDMLDSQKTSKSRNALGQFSTPYPLALDIMTYMKTIAGNNPSFLEPAIGTGVFYSAYSNVFTNDNQRVLGFEIDSHYYNPTNDFWNKTPLEIKCANFFEQKPDYKFDMIVTNPPYIRHHHIDTKTKAHLQQKILQTTGIKLSSLAGLYCHFIMLSTEWLKENGLSCWLVPSEFMDVNYGEAVKRYLLEKVELVHIHRFEPDDLQFADALVSSCIVVFRNTKPLAQSKVVLSLGGSINKPNFSKTVELSTLKSKEKWTGLFTDSKNNNESHIKLGDFFTVKRGIATGDNSFFIVNKDIIDRYEIPDQFLRPILPSPRYIKGNLINSKNGLPILEQQQFLFSCHLPERVVKEKFPKVWQYINSGCERGVNDGYICSRRTPWYSCEDREPAAIVVPYMGRSETPNRLFRFILNTSKAITTNVYLLLYPKPQYADCMKDEKILSSVWRELNSIPTETLTRNGRFYGGGLHKMEPNELMRTPADCIAPLMVSKQRSLFD